MRSGSSCARCARPTTTKVSSRHNPLPAGMRVRGTSRLCYLSHLLNACAPPTRFAGFLALLGQLSQVGDVTEEQFKGKACSNPAGTLRGVRLHACACS